MPPLHSLCLFYTPYASFILLILPLTSLSFLYTPYPSFTLLMPPLHSLCLLYTPYASFTLIMPPLHSFSLLYTPHTSFTLLIPLLQSLSLLYTLYASFTFLIHPFHSLCHFYTLYVSFTLFMPPLHSLCLLYTPYKSVWKSNVSNELKTRLFIATVESVLLYGCESWTFTSALERSLDGCYTRMLRAALNISWQSFVPNEELYGTLPRISDKVAWRRLGLAGHCFRHKELLAGELVLWEPTHGRRGRGRPSATFIDTLKRDLGTDDKLVLEVCMTNQEDWRARRAARLRPP